MVREVERTAKNFFDGNGLALLGSNLLMGTLLNLVPRWSLSVFLFFMVITLIETVIAWVWWKKGMEIVRFNSLTAFLLLATIGLFGVFPLFRMIQGILFWLVLIIYLLVAFYALYRKELIFQAFHNPRESKLIYGIFGVFFVFLILGAFSFRNGQEMVILASLNDHQGALYVAGFAYALGLFFTFISTALLKKPSEIK
ncbi:hypothetical protein [Robertmurraya sp. P23]|uniref:hypothetical protein n=1 Tax=Robertmurraya sp. P23 TaxID=3436931 RepID=UPI003D97FEEC